MKSTTSARGKTVVTAEIRRRFRLSAADGLEWIVVSDGNRVVPVRRNPIDAFRGRGKGGGTRRLIQDRWEELAHDTQSTEKAIRRATRRAKRPSTKQR